MIFLYHMNTLKQFDQWFILFIRKYGDEFARLALFIIYFWFGFLKLFSLSPAGPLVVSLLEVTFLSFIAPDTFLFIFGLFEMLLGIMALVPKLERFTFLLIGLHLITTAMPLFLLRDITWLMPFVPTLIGQYIFKNLALLSIGLLLFARIIPMTKYNSVFAHEEE